MTVRITIHETNGLDETNHTLHVDVPTDGTALAGPRGFAVEAEDWAHLRGLLQDAAKIARLARPTIQTIQFEFSVPN